VLPASSHPPTDGVPTDDIRDPREVLRRNRRPVCAANPAAERIERLLAVQGDWLRCRVRSTAQRFRLDPDELCQELMLSMLRRSTTVDEGNKGVRTWLGSRVDWTAKDILRRRGREEAVGPEDLQAIDDDMIARRPTPEFPGPVTLDVRHLVEQLGLTQNEAQVVAMRCTGVDMPLKDFAELVHRRYADMSREYERGTRKIERLFGLTAEEVRVVRAWRKRGTAAAAAPHVDKSGDEVIQILEGARKKIDRIFDETEGRP
jgi:DNA-directed RNA polymerase specialized sigma24 family protein